MVTVADVKARVQEVQELPEKLLFVVGGAGSGKSKLLREVEQAEDYTYVEAKELLMEKLFEMENEERKVEAKESFVKAFKALAADVVILDGVEILFAPIFKLEPLEVLKKLSQDHTIIIGWRGSFDGKTLKLEHNSKENYFSFDIDDPKQVITLD